MNKNILNYMIKLHDNLNYKSKYLNSDDTVIIIKESLNDYDFSKDNFESKDDFISIYVSYLNYILLNRTLAPTLLKEQNSSKTKKNPVENTNNTKSYETRTVTKKINKNNKEMLRTLGTLGLSSLALPGLGLIGTFATSLAIASAIINEPKTITHDFKVATNPNPNPNNNNNETESLDKNLKKESSRFLGFILKNIHPNIDEFELDDLTKEYLKLITEGIVRNDIDKFKKAVTLNSEYSIGNLYLFMHYFNEMSYSNAQKEIHTNSMTKYWNRLNENWQEYLLSNENFISSLEEKLSSSNLNQFCCIPYISYELLENPMRDRMIESLLDSCQNLNLSFLSKLDNDEDTQDFDDNDFDAKEEEFCDAISKFNYYMLQLNEYDSVNNKSLFDESKTKNEIIKNLYEIIFYNQNPLSDSTEQETINIKIFHKDFIPMLKKYFNSSYPSIFYTKKTDILKQVLQIPSYSNIRQLDIKNAIALSNKAMEFEKLNIELEKQKKAKAKLLDENVHTWQHIAYHEITVNLAKQLLEENPKSEVASQLLDIHTAQKLLLNSLKVLGEEFNYNNNEEYIKRFKSSMCSSKYSTAVGVKESLSLALKTSLGKVFYEGSCSPGDNILNKENRNSLKNSYLNNINLDKVENILDWFSEEIYPINIINLENWSNIYFKREELSYFKFIEIFLNLINNVLNYGVKNESGYLNIEFDKRTINEIEFYILKMKNPIEKSTAFLGSQKKGIDSIKSNIEKINNDTSFECVVVKENKHKNFFEIEILINSKNFGK